MSFDGVELINGMTQEEFNLLTREEKKAILVESKQRILSRIKAINPHIHRLVLTGKRYLFRDLEKFFYQLSTGHDPHHNSFYQRTSFGYHNGKRWTVLTNPMSGYMPQCKLWTVGIEPEDLYDLALAFPRLIVECAEYALDFMCDEPEHVRSVFNLIKRNSYVPYLRPDKFALYDHSENCTLHLGNYKIYERGPDDAATYVMENDSTIRRTTWAFNVLDRVRIELTARSRLLINNFTREIDTFCACPSFDGIRFTPNGRPRLRFVKFKDGTAAEYPKEYDPYEEEQLNIDGFPRSIQNELFFLRDLNPRASSKLINDDGFHWLRIRMKQAVAAFDSNWRRRVIDYDDQPDDDQEFDILF